MTRLRPLQCNWNIAVQSEFEFEMKTRHFTQFISDFVAGS